VARKPGCDIPTHEGRAVDVKKRCQILLTGPQVEDTTGLRDLDLGVPEPRLDGESFDHPLHVSDRVAAPLLGARLPVPLGLVERAEHVEVDALDLPEPFDDFGEIPGKVIFHAVGQIAATRTVVTVGAAILGHVDWWTVDERDEAFDSPFTGRQQKPALAGETGPVIGAEIVVEEGVRPSPHPADVLLPATPGTDVEPPHR
jgi:hypothetical protein